MANQTVVFQYPVHPYNPGESVSLPLVVAHELARKGVVTYSGQPADTHVRSIDVQRAEAAAIIQEELWGTVSSVLSPFVVRHGNNKS